MYFNALYGEVCGVWGFAKVKETQVLNSEVYMCLKFLNCSASTNTLQSLLHLTLSHISLQCLPISYSLWPHVTFIPLDDCHGSCPMVCC